MLVIIDVAPATAHGLFRGLLGTLNLPLGAGYDEVWLVVAGRVLP